MGSLKHRLCGEQVRVQVAGRWVLLDVEKIVLRGAIVRRWTACRACRSTHRSTRSRKDTIATVQLLEEY